jgi:hypothetical protein
MKQYDSSGKPDTLCKNVKDRGTFFHVRFSSVIRGGKKVSQRYCHFKSDESKGDALILANKKAIHLELRHNQLRQAHQNNKSLIERFINNGFPIGISINQRVRNGSKRIIMCMRNSIDGVQYKKELSLLDKDPELLVFDAVFNKAFAYVLSNKAETFSPYELLSVSILMRFCLIEQYKKLTGCVPSVH